MTKCFVIQPFDKGKFDKRYEDVFAPAISDAQLEPYRVDRDPSVSIPIDEIQKGIGASAACLAEISTDNPNVWFELGFAIASQKEVVLVCSKERDTPFPFDVQHRSIISYSAESTSDFQALRSQITERVRALLKRKESLQQVAQIPSVAKLEGLEQYEIAALIAVTQQSDDPSQGVGAFRVRDDMENAGFTPLATVLGLRTLLSKKMLEAFQDQDFNGYPFTAYRTTEAGISWLLANQHMLALKKPPAAPSFDDEIPF